MHSYHSMSKIHDNVDVMEQEFSMTFTLLNANMLHECYRLGE